ncbi:MAG TPA: WYL domain-containing protein, partial [Ktedonobacterales bacterium]
AQSFDAQYRAAAQSAASKLTAALPERLRDEVAALRERIQVGPDGATLQPEIAATLRALRGAVIARQRVRFRYFTRYPHGARPASAPGETAPWRVADPYALTRLRGAWYLNAWCHLRKDIRNFRLERIEGLTLLDERFPPPSEAPKRPTAPPRAEGATVEARILFDAEAARWARESPSFFTVAQEETADGGLLVTLRLRHAEDITQWLLGWGAHARVLEPLALRQRLAEEAAALLRLYQAE